MADTKPPKVRTCKVCGRPYPEHYQPCQWCGRDLVHHAPGDVDVEVQALARMARTKLTPDGYLVDPTRPLTAAEHAAVNSYPVDRPLGWVGSELPKGHHHR